MVALWTVPPQGAAKREHSPAETGKETARQRLPRWHPYGAPAQPRGGTPPLMLLSSSQQSLVHEPPAWPGFVLWIHIDAHAYA